MEFTSEGHSGTSLSLRGEATLTFAATVNNGYKFLGWYNGDTLISESAEYTEGYSVNGKTTIKAKFEAYLAPGLYETGTKTLKTSWDDLISNGILSSSGKIVSGQEANLAGDLVIPEGVTTIEKGVFRGCTGLTSIEIPASVTSINDYAFQDCTNLTSITFAGTIEQWSAITKGSSWNTQVPATYVQCSDGQVTL